MRDRDALPNPMRARSSLVALACLGLMTAAFACEPAEQAAVERRAREVSREVAHSAKVQAGNAARATKRELDEFEDKARRGARRVRERSDDAREMLNKYTPPPESTPPVHATSAIICDADACTIDRATVELYAKEPMMLLHEGSVLPLPGGDSEGGLRVLSLRAGGLGERLGLRPGDTLLDVDGVPLTDLLRDPAARQKLGGSRRWTLRLRRDGDEVRRTVALR